MNIRPFASFEEYQACTDFQEEVWGRGFSEKVSAAILMIANRLGGLAAGAFNDRGDLQGFVFGLTGVMDGSLVHWSDMLAVREGVRDVGLGTRLKRYQREVVLTRGVKEMRWTFDPLQGRNAHVNFNKLGIVCREYVENMYGETDSPLHRGIGTDRLVAVWMLESPHVIARLGGAPGEQVHDFREAPAVLPYHEGEDLASPATPRLGLESPVLLLAVPAAIEPMMARAMPLAVDWRKATREAFIHYLSRGYEASDFIRGKSVSHYVLTRSTSQTLEGGGGREP